MNMKRLMALALALVLALCLCACGGKTDEPAQQPSQDPKPTAPAATEPAEDPSEDAPANENPVYTVRIVDEGGNGIAGAMVQMCQGETCMPGPLSDENGVVTFQIPEAEYKVSFLGGVPAGYDYTTEQTEFTFEAGSYELTIVLKAVA